jgi:hypothetical protein
VGDAEVTAKVIPLPNVEPPKIDYHAGVIDECERLLGMALLGQIRSMAVAVVRDDGGTQTSYTNCDNDMHAMVNAAGVLNYRLMKRFVDGSEPE